MRVAAFGLAVALVAGALTVSAAVHDRVVRGAPSFASKATPRGRLRTPLSGGYPPCDPNVKQYSGYFDIDAATDKHYFFWFFESRVAPSSAPVLLWMTGGPGCSSSLATMVENGACHVNLTTGELYRNPYSWNSVANVLYIDQPAGVGFSYGGRGAQDHNEKEVARDMYDFMQAFFTQFPQYQKNAFFVYGESYGGHFAPATAYRIVQGNEAKEGHQINLKGLSVGNGLTDPVVQYQWYAPLAYDWCQTVLGKPCVTKAQYEGMLSATSTCVALVSACNEKNQDCAMAADFCNNAMMGPYESTGLNVYDIRKPCVGSLCYHLGKVTDFMNQADVQQALGVAPQASNWVACNYTVNGAFTKDWAKSFNQSVAGVIASGARVLIYSGDMDFICNWMGNKAYITQLQWPGGDAFRAALDVPWYVNEEPAGRARSTPDNKLTFLQVHSAGHMVPMDQPQRALAMVVRFLDNISFNGYPGPQP
jgi:cathepsin A (carboxypeptidase C)